MICSLKSRLCFFHTALNTSSSPPAPLFPTFHTQRTYPGNSPWLWFLSTPNDSTQLHWSGSVNEAQPQPPLPAAAAQITALTRELQGGHPALGSGSSLGGSPAPGLLLHHQPGSSWLCPAGALSRHHLPTEVRARPPRALGTPCPPQSDGIIVEKASETTGSNRAPSSTTTS